MGRPDYHSCLTEVLASPVACRSVMEELAQMTEADARRRWPGQQLPPTGHAVNDQVPAEVRARALEGTLEANRKGMLKVWEHLAKVAGVDPQQQSMTELIENLRWRIEHLQSRIAELEAQNE